MPRKEGSPNPEGLTGKVQNKPASDLEERVARAIVKMSEWTFTFRVRIQPITHAVSTRITNIKGEVEIDFLCRRGETSIIPIMVQGEYSHFKTPWQNEVDLEKEAVINDTLRPLHARPVVRVPDYKKGLYMLETQEMADQTMRSILT